MGNVALAGLLSGLEQCAKVMALVPSQGTYKKQPMNA